MKQVPISFRSLLIANRGEIAVRIIKSAKRMGLRTIAVYSNADKNALHVKIADEAVMIGEGPATQSYLSIEKVIDAARQSGADAIHPGYGFLSEKCNFCRRMRKGGYQIHRAIAARNADYGRQGQRQKACARKFD